MNRDITISELPATTVADDNSYIPIDNGDITYRIKVSDYNAGANVTAKAYAEAAGTHASAAAESASSAAEASDLCMRRVEMTESSVRTASDKANEAQTYANTAYEYAAAASTSASNATSQAQQVSDYAREAGEKSEDAEAFAVGQRKGVDVTSEDETFENNAKYYKEQASAEVARISDLTANVSSNALKAEGYAVGTQNGSPILSEYSQNNAKYYAENAASSAHIARVSKDTAVQYAKKAESAVVKAPYIGDNNHWYVYNFDQEEYIDTNVGATGNPGTPGQKGDTGITPTITATASVDNTSGTPSVTVQKSGSNTNPSFAFSFSGLKGQPGDGSGTSYDDTEIKAEINDIWKAQGELGAKNLLPYPYSQMSNITQGVTFTADDEGGISVVGESTSWASFRLYNRNVNFLDVGSYIISLDDSSLLPNVDGLNITIDGYVNGTSTRLVTLSNGIREAQFVITNEMSEIMIAIVCAPSKIFDFTIHPMIRLAEDTDKTWQPYVFTNYELMQNDKKLAESFESDLANLDSKFSGEFNAKLDKEKLYTDLGGTVVSGLWNINKTISANQAYSHKIVNSGFMAGDIVAITGYQPTAYTAFPLCVFYDANMNQIGIINPSSSGGFEKYEAIIPSGTTQFYINGFAANNQYIAIAYKVDYSTQPVSALNYAVKNWMQRRYQDGEYLQFTQKTLDHAIITFSVDDSNSDVSSVSDLFINKGVPLCLATIPEKLNYLCDNGDTVLQTCLKTVNHGGEILTHNGFVIDANTTPQQYYDYFVSSKRMLEEAGLRVRGIIKAGGGTDNPNIETTLTYLRSYYDYGTGFQYVTDNRYNIGRLAMYGSLEELKSQVSNISSGGIINFYAHGSSDMGNEWLTTISELIDYIQSIPNAEIVTIGSMALNNYIPSFKRSAPLIGEYLPTTANGTVKKYSAQAGATTATFNASGFMAKYGLSSTDLVFDVSAETANGQVVTYNSVTVNSSGVVTVTFDALSEATTFICKCSTI